MGDRLVSPSETEAQCVALEVQSLVDGDVTVTEDSDIFVFCGRKVYKYKNFFAEHMYAEAYYAKDRMSLRRLESISL